MKPALAAPLLALLLAPLTAQEPPHAGFRLLDSGYAGMFGNATPDTLELQAGRGTSVHGTLVHGAEFSIAAELVDGRLRGTGQILDRKLPFTCERQGEDLNVRLGDDTFAVRRVVQPLPVLADLGAPVPDDQRRWTVAIYFGADNNLEPGAMSDLAELRQIQALPGVEVIAFVDRCHGELTDPTDDWTDCRVLRLRPGQDHEILLQPGELPSNHPSTLAGFLTGAFRKFPSPHRAAFLWDHGGGWIGMIEDEDPAGLPYKGPMRMPHIRWALRTTLHQLGIPRLDLVVADACLMAQLDSALSLHGLANVLVASQTKVAGSGLPYHTVLPAFADQRNDTRAIATAAVAAFGEFYREGDEPDPDATLAAIDLDAVPQVARSLDELAATLLPSVDTRWPQIARALYYGESDDLPAVRTTGRAGCGLDLVDLAERLVAGIDDHQTGVANMLLEGMVSRAVFAHSRGDQRGLARGLSVFGPRRKEQALAPYVETPIGAGSRFWELLTKVLDRAAADTTPVTVGDLAIKTFGGEVTTTVRPFDGAAVHFVATGNSIVAAQHLDLMRDEEAKLWVILRRSFVGDPTWPQRALALAAAETDLLMPQFQDGRNELRSELFGMSWSIQNESMRVRATIDLTGDNSRTPITARALLQQPGWTEAKAVDVVFGRASWIVERVVLRDAPADGLIDRVVTMVPASKLTFVLEAIDAEGKRIDVECDPIEFGTGLRLVLSADEPGRYKAAMLAETAGGKTAVDEIDYTLVANPDLATWTNNWKGFAPDLLHGRWLHNAVIGPDLVRDTGATVEFVEQLAPDKPLYRVKRKLAAAHGGAEYLQTWILDLAGVPNLRILTPMPDGRVFCWFGPATWSKRDDRPTLVFKAMNVDSGLWEFQQTIYDSLRTRRDK